MIGRAVRLSHRLSLLQRVSRREGHGAGRLTRDTGAHLVRRAKLLPHKQVGIVRAVHFAAISERAPLVGPVLAAQFGFLPGLLWLVIGVTIGGAVHDFVILASSVRRRGKSLAEIARTEISPVSGLVTGIAILFIVVIALPGWVGGRQGAWRKVPWGTFTVGFTITARARSWGSTCIAPQRQDCRSDNDRRNRSVIAVILGGRIAESSTCFDLHVFREHSYYLMAGYGFIGQCCPYGCCFVA